jgi:hypothetical protein
MLVLALAFPCYGAKLTQKQLVFRDETGKKLSWTTLTSVAIYDAGTTDEASIYSDRNGNTSKTNPIVSGLSDPLITFWSKDADYKVVATDGTYTLTADNVTGSDGWLVFPRYLQAMSSRTANDSQSFTFGTTSDWVAAAQDSGMDWTPAADNSAFYIGTTAFTSDLFLYGGTSNYDLQWDASRNQLTFRDNTVLGFGAGAASGAADYTIKTAGSTGNLVLTAVTADDFFEIVDGTTATDFKIQNTTTATADIWWDDSTEIFHYGVTNYGVDVKFWADTTGDYMIWDESADELYFEDADLKMNEGGQIEFCSTDNATDWTIDLATAERLTFTPTESDDTQTINFGNATYTTDFRLFGATASTIVFDASGNEVIFDAYDISLQDGDFLKFGDGDDFTMDSSTTKILDIAPAAATDDYAIYAGLNESGVDLKLFGATDGEYWLWDASADSILPNCGNALFTMTDAEADQFKVDATGAVNGDAINFETTNGGIMLNADGENYGDIELNSADDMIITSAGDTTITTTGTLSVAGSAITNYKIAVESVTENKTITAAESGELYMVGVESGAAADIVLTLPTAAAGLIYHVVDANETEVADVTITAASGDKIDDGSAAASVVHDTDAENFASITLVAIDATNWVTITSTGTWAAE